eukprot:Em0014g616a
MDQDDVRSQMDYDILYFITRQQGPPASNAISEADTASSRVGRCLATTRRSAVATLPPERIMRTFEPPKTKRAWLEFMLVHVPILRWLWTYQLSYLPNDIVAGFTIAIMQLPQGLAYAVLANLDPVYGLYTAIVPVIVYSIFGTSRHVSIGTVAVLSLLVGNSVNQILSKIGMSACSDAANSAFVAFHIDNETNITCGALKGEIAISLAMTSGLLMFVMGVLHLGFVTVFLSEPLIAGYVTASGLITFTSQISNIFGMKINIKPVISNYPDILSVPCTWIEALRQIFQWPKYINTATFVISLISILLLIVVRIVNVKALSKIKCVCCRYSRSRRVCFISQRWKWPIPIPSPLLLVICGILLSYFFHFDKKFKVAVVGSVPAHLPPVAYPRGNYMLTSLPNAIVLAFVTFAVSLSLAKVFGKKFGYSIDSNQELLAYGLTNIIGSLFSSFNVGSSISRSQVQVGTKGKTQIVGVLSALIIAVSLVSFGGLLSPLPRAILASIIWVALYTLFKQFKDVWVYFKTSITDMLVWLTVFVGTLLLGVDLGFAVGVGFSLLVVVFKVALPQTTLYKEAEVMNSKMNVPSGTLVYVFKSPLCFLNTAVFTETLELAAGIKTKGTGIERDGCIKQIIKKIWKCTNPNCDDVVNPNLSAATPAGISTRLHTVVIDCAAMGYFDTVGAQALIQAVLDFECHGIVMMLAALSNENQNMLARCGFDKKCGRTPLFLTVQEAVNCVSLQLIENPIDVDAEMVPMYGEDSFANPMETTNVAETIFSGSEDEQEYFHVRIGSELW